MINNHKNNNGGKPSIGVIQPSQTRGSNAFAKNITTCIAVGQWDANSLQQYRDRMGRRVPAEEQDIIPEEFQFMHVQCKECALVTDAMISRSTDECFEIHKTLNAKMSALADRAWEVSKKCNDGYLDGSLSEYRHFFMLVDYSKSVNRDAICLGGTPLEDEYIQMIESRLDDPNSPLWNTFFKRYMFEFKAITDAKKLIEDDTLTTNDIHEI